MTRLRILHLEDNEQDMELIRETLLAEGFDFVAHRVVSQADFLAAVEQGGFDIILADYALPSFNGQEALRLALEKQPGVPFIFVSGAIGAEQAIELLKQGATDYILKDQLAGLAPAIHRAQREVAERVARQQTAEALRQSRDQLEAILHGIAEGITVQDPTGRLIYANQNAAHLIGYPSKEALLAAPPSELLGSFEALDEAGRPFPLTQLPGRLALQGHYPTEVLLRFRNRADGTERWSIVNATPVFDEQGQVQFAVNIFRDVTERTRLYESEKEARQAAEASAARIAGLQQVTAALAEALTPAQVAEAVIGQGLAVLGASAGSIALLNEDATSLDIIHAAGYPEALLARWRQIPLTADETGFVAPLAEAVRAGEPIFLESPQHLSEAYPPLPSQALTSHHAWAAIPLIVEGRPIGAMGLSFITARHFSSDDRAFILSLARQGAQALERARLYEAERTARLLAEAAHAETEAARQRLHFLAEAGMILAASLNHTHTLNQVAQLIVPPLADWCGIFLLEADAEQRAGDGRQPISPGSLQLVAVATADPADLADVREALHLYPTDPTEETLEGLSAVVQRGQPILYPELPEAFIRDRARNERQLTLLRRIHSLLIVPLPSRGRVLGALVLATTSPTRPLGDGDLTLAEELSRRAALAIDNAQLYQQAGRLNQALEQRVDQRTAELQIANTQLQTTNLQLQEINIQLEAEIAERSQIEEALRQSEARFAGILDTAHEAIISVDASQRILIFNQGAEQIFGYTAAELIGLPLDILLPERFRLRHRQHISDFGRYHSETSRRMGEWQEIYGRRKNGETFPAEATISRLQVDNHHLFTVVLRDITERHQAEARLRRSQAQLAEAQRIARIGSWEWDIAADQVTWSDEMYALLGLDPAEFQPSYQAFLDLVHPEDRAHVHHTIQTSARTGQPYNFDCRMVRPDGGLWINQLRGQVVRDAAGNITGIVGTGQDVTELEQAQAQLERNARQLAAVAAMGQAVTATLDLAVVLDRVLAQTSPLIAAEGTSILLREPLSNGEEQFRFVAVSGPGIEGMTGQTVPLTAGVAGEVLTSGRPAWIRDATSREHLFNQIERGDRGGAAYRVRTLLVVPLKLRGDTIGVIEAVHSRLDAFSQDDLHLLEAAASWTAIAIGNARLYHALMEEKRHLELLYTLSQHLVLTLDPYEVAVRALDLTTSTLGALRGEFFIIEPDADRLRLLTIAGYEAETTRLLDSRRTLKIGQGLTGYAAQTRRPIVAPDLACDEHWLPLPGLDDDICSAAAVPLLVGDSLVGVLSLFSEQVNFFNEAHLPLLQAVAAPVALATQNARLYQVEQAARRTAETLRLANQALSQSLDMDHILDALLDHLGALVPFDSASVMLREAEEQLIMRATRGYEQWTDPALVQQLTFQLEETPNLKKLITTRQGYIIPDTAAYPGWIQRRGVEYIRNWLGVPLVVQGKAIGVFALDKTEPHFFTEAHLQLVEALAIQAAIAIQNAQLYGQVRDGREQLRRLSHQAVNALEEERRRVSRELHDEAGQALTALKISLTLLQRELPDAMSQQIGEAIQLTTNTMEQIRLLAQDLRPPALDYASLNSTLENFCRDFTHRTRLPIHYQGQELPSLPDTIRVSLYRFLQESLTNVAKHAQARQVQVTLRHDGHTIRLQVSDDGKGFDIPTRTESGIGLLSMQERFSLLGGWIDIVSAPGEGTRIQAIVPWPTTR